MRRIVPIFALLAGLVFPLRLEAQNNPSDIRMRLGQSYEKSEDYEAAIRVYDELFAADSANLTLIEALKRCNLKLKQYDRTIALIEHGLRLNPGDLGSLAQLGNVWFLRGDEQKAVDAWHRAVAVQPGDETTYRVVGNSMVMVRQFERAVETYREGRKALDNPALFAQDIAYLYAVMQRYRGATEEYLVLLRQAPSQLNYIQARIATYTGNDEGLRAATEVTLAAVEADPKKVELRRLAAWLSMEAKDYGAALETYRRIDDLAAAGGRELFGFAERALNEKAYPAASRAYADVIERNPGFREMPRVRLGLARSLEELAAGPPDGGDTSSAARYAKAVGMYGRIVFDYPNTDYAAQALFRLASVKRDHLGDPDGAKEVLERIAREYKIFQPVATQAKLALGEVCVELDDLDRAAIVFSELAGPPPFGGPDREKAALRLAELRFYRAEYDAALGILADLSRNAASDAANDAIPLQMMIGEFRKSDPAGLKAWAAARLLRVQHRDADALRLLDDAVNADTAGALADRFAFLRGEILSGMTGPARIDEAISAYSVVIDRFPDSLLRDRAMFAVAGLREGRADRLGAIAMYERLLEKYPNSIHANAARKKIRELRGDNI